jgi:hypothetical protein
MRLVGIVGAGGGKYLEASKAELDDLHGDRWE